MLAGIAALTLAPQALATDFTVDSTNDEGAGSLRQAIVDANTSPGLDTITLAITGPDRTITPASPLPTITGAVSIQADPSTLPDGLPTIRLDGGNASGAGISGLAFDVTTPGVESLVTGLAVTRWTGANGAGITISGGSAVTVRGTLLGTDASAASLGNYVGVAVYNGSTIGGSAPSDRNVISGNNVNGVFVGGSGAVVRGNWIGVGPGGDAAVPNGTGVFAQADGATIAQNVIRGNTGTGVRIVSGSNGIAVSENAIGANGDLGIDLGFDGVTANDAGDGDAGPNGLQNYPVLDTGAVNGDGDVDLSGTLDSTGSSSFTLEFFAGPSCDPSGNGEGAEFVGSTSVSTGEDGKAAFSYTTNGHDFVDGEVVTATATNASGSTSELSACLTIGEGGGGGGEGAGGTSGVFTVNTTSDESADAGCTTADCTLREAITEANATPNAGGPDRIEFDLPPVDGDVEKIHPLTDLPPITEPVIVDGTTQSGFAGSPLVLVEDDGSCDCGGSGLTVAAAGSGSTIRGLAIGGFPAYGIELNGGSVGTVVRQSMIGIAPVDYAYDGNADGGIGVLDSANNRIGGNEAADRVYLGANAPSVETAIASAQIVISGAGSTGNVVEGSNVGLGPDGVDTYDTEHGIWIGNGAGANTIGGSSDSGQGNTVTGLYGAGILLDGAGAGNVVAGNRIGLDDEGGSGEAPGVGIEIDGTDGTIVGADAGPGDLFVLDRARGNVVAGADSAAISLGQGTSGSIVAGNALGVDRSGEATNPNDVGIDLADASDNQLGPGNTIAFSDGAGIYLDGVEATTLGNRIVANSIHDNGGDGIVLAGGANRSLAAPVVSSATPATVSGTVSGPAATTLFVEVFRNASCDGTAAGETYLSFVSVTIPAGEGTQTATWSASLDGLAVGDGVTATSTNSATNDTSPFSGCSTVTEGGGEAPAAPILFGAVPNVGVSNMHLGAAGLVQDPAVGEGVAFSVSLYGSAACGDAEPDYLGSATITTNANGVAAFAIDTFDNAADGTFVWATAARGEGPVSDDSNCVRVGPNNTSWTTALTLDPNGTTTGYLGSLGEGRWFKVPILPNGRVDVTLSNLPQDYDLIVFKDIQQSYDELVGGADPSTGGPNLSLDDLARQGASAPTDAFNTSLYNPNSWDPTNWDPTLNSSVFSPSQWSPSQWSPSQWSPSQWSPSQWSPSQWSPSQWSPSQWSPSQWSPSQWSPSQWSPSDWASAFPTDPKIFSDAQTTSLLAVAAGPGTGAESISANTWNNTGFFYVRVQGKNGAYDPDKAFTLTLARQGNACLGISDQPSSPAAAAGGFQTVILVDRARLAIDPTLNTKLSTLAARPEVRGVVVDVDADPAVRGLNAQADARPSCPYAKNLVAGAVKRIVSAYRASNPVRYVVLVGGDSVLPFFRYPDPSLLGPETLYSPPVLDSSASQASLRLGYVLDQDGYGSTSSVSLHGNAFPVPGLAVGRLVETPAEIGGLLDAYLGLAGGTVPTPTTSLVTGYDFLQDAADAVQENLAAGIGAPGDTLITNQSVSPATVTVGGTPDRNHSWTATDLRAKLLGPARHDLVFLAGHFSANDALAADYATNVLSTELATSTTDFRNSIVFSAGCHSGYNIVNGDAIPNVTGPLDWAEAFAAKRATLIAGTGYQYGDTDFLAYSERIYAEFSRQLRLTSDPSGGRTPVAVGEALLRSKRAYLKTTPVLSALDEKALLEATLFGLPMLSVDLPQGRIYEPSGATTIPSISPVGAGPGAALGLRVADTSVSGPGTPRSLQLKNPDGTTGPLATYLAGADGVATAPIQPVLPLFSRDVTSPTGGYLLRGVGFRSGSYTDTPGVTPLTSAPATELRGIHAPFYTDVFFPVQPFTTNYYDALGGGGGTQLMVTPVQHLSDSPLTSVRRAFSDLDFRLFYSNELGWPALAAPPTVTGVSASFDAGTRKLTVGAHVLGDVGAGIQEVWATWTIPPTGGGAGVWQSFDLVRDTADQTLWSGTLQLGAGVDPATVAFLLQAANGVGRVVLDANVGAFYRFGSIPRGEPGGAAPAATTTTFATAPPAAVVYGSDVTIAVKVTAGSTGLTGAPVRIGLGSTSIPAVTNAQGVATATLHVGVVPGSYRVTGSYAGDADHAASNVSAPITVGVRPTVLTLSGTLGTQSLGSPLSIVATLKDAATPPTPLLQRPVFVVVAGTGPGNGSVTRVFSGQTDPLGRFAVAAASLATLPVGSYDVGAYFNGVSVPGVISLEADDIAYAHSEAHATLSVQWPFSGFFAPVDNPPTVNVAKAGSAVPVKFGLGGDRGLAIFASGYPRAVQTSCTSGVPTDTIDTTVTAGGSSLQYDPASDRYTYVWKTQKGWSGCWELQVVLVDGSRHVAEFKFK